MNPVRGYFSELAARFGDGWNRFWYTPIDPAGIGLIRLGTGLVALYFLLTFSWDLDAFLGSQGLLPRPVVRAYMQQDGQETVAASFSYFFNVPDSRLVLVHALGIAVVLAFALGLFSRVTSVLALVVVLSYLHRAPMITGPLEALLALVMAYLCLAPSGAAFSLDAWWRRRRGRAASPSRLANVATRLIQLHLCLMMFMMGLAKAGADGWWTGSSIWWLISRVETCPLNLTGLAAVPMLLEASTYAVLFFELAYASLIWHRLARPLVLAGVVLLNGWACLVSNQLAFWVLLVTANLAFVSPGWLRSVAGRCCPGEAAWRAGGGAAIPTG